MKVVRRFRTETDRTALPTELLAELEAVKTQERELRQRDRELSGR